MYDYLDLRQTEKLKELVPYKALAPDADEIIKELERLNNIIDELERWLIEHIDEYRDMEQDAMFEFGLVLDKLKELKENNKNV